MCCSAPRYWMVAVVCVLMCTTLCVEYIRVVYSYHPAIHTGFLNYSSIAHYPTIRNLSVHNLPRSNVQSTHPPKQLELTISSHVHNYTSYSPSYKINIRTGELPSLAGVHQNFMVHNRSVYSTTSPVTRKNQSKNQRWYHKHRVPQVNKSSVASKLTEKEKRWRKMQRFHARNRGVGVSAHLLQLVGLDLSPKLDLHSRGFPEWNNTSLTAVHLPILQQATQGVHLDGTSLDRFISRSMNPDIVARGYFQTEQVKKFCTLSGQKLSRLPSNPEVLTTLFTHLLYDDSKRIVFCYVPKNGCSNMKRLLLILNGLLPPESAQQNRPSERLLKKVKSFRNLTAEEAIYKLENYYKFAIVRNPLERLLSAYRNKLEHPVVYADRKHFPSSLQLFIMSLFRPSQVQLWLESVPEKRHSIFPSFKEFVTYMKIFPLGDYNEHFAPFSELCQPCSIEYDFYANFKIMDYDTTAVLEYLSIPSSYYPSFVTTSHNTTGLMNEYYRLVSWREKTALFNAFRTDLNIYYSLYPEEKDMHQQLLSLG